MTAEAALTYTRPKKRIRYFRRAIHVHSQKTILKVIKLGAGPKLSERLPQAKALPNATPEVRLAALSAATRTLLRNTAQAHHDWHALGSAGLLARINDPRFTPRDQEMAVLFAETTVFDGLQRARMLAELARFIERNRFTRNRNAITAVGAATRKYAMNMDESQFERYGSWLRPSETETLSCRVELELVKALCWRLCYLHISTAVTCPDLTSALVEVATAYLSPRLIVQKNFAAIALQAITAVAILQSRSGDRTAISFTLGRVSALRLGWFSELLDDRLQESYEAIGQYDAQLAEQLRQVIENAQ